MCSPVPPAHLPSVLQKKPWIQRSAIQQWVLRSNTKNQIHCRRLCFHFHPPLIYTPFEERLFHSRLNWPKTPHLGKLKTSCEQPGGDASNGNDSFPWSSEARKSTGKWGNNLLQSLLKYLCSLAHDYCMHTLPVTIQSLDCRGLRKLILKGSLTQFWTTHLGLYLIKHIFPAWSEWFCAALK